MFANWGNLISMEARREDYEKNRLGGGGKEKIMSITSKPVAQQYLSMEKAEPLFLSAELWDQLLASGR